MATSITWAGGDGVTSISPAESGTFDTLGMFGASFGISIRVGEYNDTSFSTNDDGTSFTGSALPNNKFANSTGVFIPAFVDPLPLLELEEAEAVLRIRLTTDSAVTTQNASFRAFDRVDIDNDPSGVTVLAAEVIKNVADVSGSGDGSWTTIAGTTALALEDQTEVTGVHDFYVAVTASPDSIGEKTNLGYYFECEFL